VGKPTTYKSSGVDIAKADRLIDNLKGRIQNTFNPHVLSPIGGFAALAEVPRELTEPVLVTSTDGVGTKLRVAFMCNKHDTVGIDLVAMSVNDVLTVGAKPFLFLDYYACGQLAETIYRDVLSGIVTGCEQAGCALVGGETAEMPSFYAAGEYELAGFVVAVVEKGKIIDGSSIENGDRVVALASNGLHSNGYSLARKVLLDDAGLSVTERLEGIEGTVGEALLRPTRIYVKSVLSVMGQFKVKGMAHITGGGLPGNISRIIPAGLRARLSLDTARIPPIFKVIQKMGSVPRGDMHSTFNLGAGYVLIVSEADEKKIISEFGKLGETAFSLGRIEPGDEPKVIVEEVT
jgi:phosphoribosylformylglycinamidine cyclo-ligase